MSGPSRSRFQRSRQRGRGRAQAKDEDGSLVKLVKRWMKENRVEERVESESIFSLWGQIVGEEIGSHTRVVDASGGELTVEVDSAPLLNELSTYYSQEILDSLKEHEEFRGIQKLRFRAGSF